jgi:hypothetical protein
MAGKRATKCLVGTSDEKTWSERLMEAMNPCDVLKEVIVKTAMGLIIAMIASAIIPGGGIGTQLTTALLSAGVVS